jgi:hypothetical protein
MQAHGHVAGELFPVPDRTAGGGNSDGSADNTQLVHGFAHQPLHNPVTASGAVRVGEIGKRLRSSKNLLHQKNPPSHFLSTFSLSGRK